MECVGGKPRLASWEQLMISVVRLATNLAQIPLEHGVVTSQTDELKAASTRIPCVADTGKWFNILYKYTNWDLTLKLVKAVLIPIIPLIPIVLSPSK